MRNMEWEGDITFFPSHILTWFPMLTTILVGLPSSLEDILEDRWRVDRQVEKAERGNVCLCDKEIYFFAYVWILETYKNVSHFNKFSI